MSVCETFLQKGICSKRGCESRHPKDCRHWTGKPEGCYRKETCDYLHNISKKFNAVSVICDEENFSGDNCDHTNYNKDRLNGHKELSQSMNQAPDNCSLGESTNQMTSESTQHIETLLTYVESAEDTSVNENAYCCDICDTSYNCPTELTNHNNRRHQNLSCDQCEFVSYGSVMMQHHLATSHVQFSCDDCNFIAKNKGGLTRHKNAKHENSQESTDNNQIDITTTETTEETPFIRFNFPINFGPV